MLYKQWFVGDRKICADLVRRAILVFVCFVLLASNAVNQGVQKVNLVDEFGVEIGCEEVLAKADIYGDLLSKSPDASGVLYAFASEAEEDRSERTIKFIHRALLSRWGLGVRFSSFVVRSEEALQFAFYSVPQDTELPIKGGRLVATIPFEIKVRFFFGVESGGPCTNHISSGFVSVLKSKPNYEGQVVVLNEPPKTRRNTAERILNYFAKEHGLERKRIRVFFRKSSFPNVYPGEFVEFWIKPLRSDP